MVQPHSLPGKGVYSPAHGTATLQVQGERFVHALYVAANGSDPYPVLPSQTISVRYGGAVYEDVAATFPDETTLQVTVPALPIGSMAVWSVGIDCTSN